MKLFLLTVVLATLTGGLAEASTYKYSACTNNNSKACTDARAAYAEHHNGKTPEQVNQHWYQGQRGHWNQQGKNWQWNNAEGDQWNQGKQGHWYQEKDGWRFRGDDGDTYSKGQGRWQWNRTKHD